MQSPLDNSPSIEDYEKYLKDGEKPSELILLLDCPFCGGKAELRPSELKPTIEEAITSEKNARCSTPKCPARFIICSVSEWNTRAI